MLKNYNVYAIKYSITLMQTEIRPHFLGTHFMLRTYSREFSFYANKQSSDPEVNIYFLCNADDK